MAIVLSDEQEAATSLIFEYLGASRMRPVHRYLASSAF